MSSPLDALKGFLDRMNNDPEFKKEQQEKFRNHLIKKDRPLWRAYDLIKDMDDNEFKEFLIKLFKWESEYEEMWYKRNVLTCSNILGSICSLIWEGTTTIERNIDKLGKELEFPEDSMFMAARSLYKGFIFELYVGQGSFYKIYHETEDIDFTTN